MSYNSKSISHIDYWFLRGVEAVTDVEPFNYYKKYRGNWNENWKLIFSSKKYPFIDEDWVFEPIFIRNIGDRYHVAIDIKQPDFLIFFSSFPEISDACFFKIDGVHADDIRVVDGSLVIWDGQNGVLHTVPQIKDVIKSGVDSKDRLIKSISTKSLKPIFDENIIVDRFVALVTAFTHGNEHFIFWKQGGNSFYEGILKNGVLRLSESTLGASNELLDRVTLHSAECHSDKVMVTCAESAFVLRIEYVKSKLSCKVAFGDGISDLVIASNKLPRVANPQSIVIYNLKEWYLKGHIKVLFPQDFIEIIDNPFFIIVDKNAGIAISYVPTLKKFPLFPLIGSLDKPKRDILNLSSYEVDDLDCVVVGSNGELVFWTPSSSQLKILDPKLPLRAEFLKKELNKNENIAMKAVYEGS